MHYVNGDCSIGKGFDSVSEAHLLWKRSKPPKNPTRYNLTRFAITMNELIPGLKVGYRFVFFEQSPSWAANLLALIVTDGSESPL